MWNTNENLVKIEEGKEKEKSTDKIIVTRKKETITIVILPNENLVKIEEGKEKEKSTDKIIVTRKKETITIVILPNELISLKQTSKHKHLQEERNTKTVIILVFLR